MPQEICHGERLGFRWAWLDGDLLARRRAALILNNRLSTTTLLLLLLLLLLHHALAHLVLLHSLCFHALDVLRDGHAGFLGFDGYLLLHLLDLFGRWSLPRLQIEPRRRSRHGSAFGLCLLWWGLCHFGDSSRTVLVATQGMGHVQMHMKGVDRPIAPDAKIYSSEAAAPDFPHFF